ncbi:MAG: hypothetical protein JXR22_04115 [Prolixibacteraceae bacterium]|nr:hypothetical protein [Prolixibacteraceae bacterium]
MVSKDNINFIFQLENKARAGNFFVAYIAGGILLSAAAILCVAFSRYQLLIPVSLLSILYVVLLNALKPSFVEVFVSEHFFRLNYYSVASTFRSYHSIGFELHQLKDYTVKRQFFGLKTKLILTVSSNFGLADYPPVSLSLLSKAEKEGLLHVLRQILLHRAEN